MTHNDVPFPLIRFRFQLTTPKTYFRVNADLLRSCIWQSQWLIGKLMAVIWGMLWRVLQRTLPKTTDCAAITEGKQLDVCFRLSGFIRRNGIAPHRIRFVLADDERLQGIWEVALHKRVWGKFRRNTVRSCGSTYWGTWNSRVVA